MSFTAKTDMTASVFRTGKLALFALVISPLVACSYNTSETKVTRQVLEHPVDSFQRLETDITVLGAEKLDHPAVLLARGCSSHEYTHNFSGPFLDFMAQLDADGQVGQVTREDDGNLVVEVLAARTSLRCALTSTYGVECLTQMNLDVNVASAGGTDIQPGNKAFQLKTVTRAASCNDLSRAMMIAGNEMLNTVGMAYSKPTHKAE